MPRPMSVVTVATTSFLVSIATGLFWIHGASNRVDHLCTQLGGTVVESGSICQAPNGGVLKP